MKRRDFLAKSALGAAGCLLGTGLASAVTQENGYYDPSQRVVLGKTKIKVSRVGLGTGMRGGGGQSNHTRMGQEKFNALARGCYEKGLRLFDVAELYGTHPFLAAALKDMPRKDFIIATKIWWRPGGMPEKERYPADVVVERFLKELKTDYLDLVQLHCAESEKWPTELSDYMNILAKLKKKGVIRAHGLSVHSLEAMKAALNESWVDCMHARFNPYGVKMDVKSADDVPKVAKVLKALRKQGKAVIGMKILGEGAFRNSDEKRDKSIKYALQSGCVDAMVVGFEKPNEIEDFAARVRKVPLKAAASLSRVRQSACVA